MTNLMRAKHRRFLSTMVVALLFATAGSLYAYNTKPNLAIVPASSISAQVLEADLAITKTDSPDPAAPGGLLTYNLAVTNPTSGSATATNVFVTETLPAEVTFSLATPSQGSYDSGTNIWTVGTVGTTGSATLDLVFTVNSGTPGGTVLTNTAVLAGDQFDPNLANNTVVTQTTVTSVQALKATVATIIHLPDHTPLPCIPVSSPCHRQVAPGGSVVHDKTTVTSSDATKTPTGTINLRFFRSTDDCDGGPRILEEIMTLGSTGGVTTAESNSIKLGAGEYSYRVKYMPDAAAEALGFVAAGSACERLTVLREGGVATFTFEIDTHLQPQQATVPGLSGGPPRPVGVTIGPDGERDEFVVNEVVLSPSSEADLDSFLAEYGGTVLRDGTPMLITEAGVSPAPPDTSSGAYLIRVDLSRSSLSDLQSNMTAAGITGEHLFSSNDAARLAALLARETERQISPNMVAEPLCTVCEHPDDAGGNIDAATFPWMTQDNNPSAPGDQGLSIGVIRAWEYLAYMGVPPPPPGGSFITPVIAIIDNGFALDSTTGVPLDGNSDYGLSSSSRPLQFDTIDGDGTAGGAGGDWHGQKVFGVAAARAKNFFGWAGTGGEVVKPMLIRYDGTLIVLADAVASAAWSGADVINISWGVECNWLCREYGGGDQLQADIGFAANRGVIIVASAGNAGQRSDRIPCSLNRVICVGAIGLDGRARPYSNFGSNVDIWAPDCVRTTVTPASAAIDGNNVGIDELPVVCGTSFASPFVAGIAGLMKALDRSIDTTDEATQALQVLQATANTSATTVGTVADPKVTPGWVDAFRAVSAVRPNKPPAVTITQVPVSFDPRRPVFLAEVQDPEPGGALPGAVVVRFLSDLDGELCVVRTFPFVCRALLTLGTHVITATATDPFGGKGSASLTLSITNLPPTATITSPISDIQVFASQLVNFQGRGGDGLEGPVSLTWRSSLMTDPLGTGNEISVQLPVGVHIVTLTVTDVDGATAQDSVVVTVVSGAGQPTAQILFPLADAHFFPLDLIKFEGRGFDPEDGELLGSALRWSSDIDGFLGTGPTIEKVLTPPFGCNGIISRTIKLEVTDSDKNVGIHQIRIFVGAIC